jgi:hypothetical protein
MHKTTSGWHTLQLALPRHAMMSPCRHTNTMVGGWASGIAGCCRKAPESRCPFEATHQLPLALLAAQHQHSTSQKPSLKFMIANRVKGLHTVKHGTHARCGTHLHCANPKADSTLFRCKPGAAKHTSCHMYYTQQWHTAVDVHMAAGVFCL